MGEKRNYKRSELFNKLSLKIVKNEYGRDMDPFEVDIFDVSTEGLGFHSDEQLMIGEMFEGILELWTKQKIDIVLKIVRCSVEEEGYNYGCTFIGMGSEKLPIKIYQMLEENS